MKKILLVFLVSIICSIFSFADEVYSSFQDSVPVTQVQNSVSTFKDPGRYTLFGEYVSDQQPKSNEELLSNKINLGLSFGLLNLFDKGSNEQNILSRADSVKNYFTVNASYIVNSMNFNLGIGSTYNFNYMPTSLSVGYNFFVPNIFKSSNKEYYSSSIFERNNERDITTFISETEDFMIITLGMTSKNILPLKSGYSFTTSFLFDIGLSMFVPDAQFLALNLKLSPGWSHISTKNIERNDFFTMGFEIGISVAVN